MILGCSPPLHRPAQQQRHAAMPHMLVGCVILKMICILFLVVFIICSACCVLRVHVLLVQFLFQFVLLHLCLDHLNPSLSATFPSSSSTTASFLLLLPSSFVYMFFPLLFTYFSFLVGNDSGLLPAAASPCTTTAPCCHAAHAGWLHYIKNDLHSLSLFLVVFIICSACCVLRVHVLLV